MNNFKYYRDQAKLRQVEVAEKLNLTQGAVSQWEQEESLPRAELLPEIAKLYGCTVDELLRSDTQNRPS